MRTEIAIEYADAAGRSYLTWAPVRATISLLEPATNDPVGIVVGNADTTKGGQLAFGTSRTGDLSPTLELTLPSDGSDVEFFVAGDYPKASTDDGDAIIRATAANGGAELSTTPTMVRVRKDANGLTAAERDRFTTAMATLNARGAGLFKDFRDMHRDDIALAQAHGAPGFLSWHRGYLLDLERELQKIDPSVALPYWRFDRPAPNVFGEDLMGRSVQPLGNVIFSPGNLLRQWTTDGQLGVRRGPRVDVVGAGAAVMNEAQTLALGGTTPNAIFDDGTDEGGFDDMEADPHGDAHTSFLGLIRDVHTAPRDPLFFLLHCNVDRLWALWQWLNDRFDGRDPNTFFFRGTASSPGATFIGHNLGDTMWPWNGITGGDRPPTAPRPPFEALPTAPAPPPKPTVGDMIDYDGVHAATSYMGFGYDTVPFKSPAP
jgi:tyrosinase